MAKKGFVIGAAVAALVGGAAAGAIYWQSIGDGKEEHSTNERVALAGTAPAKITYVEVKELTLRLADTSTEHYIKLSPVLAVRTSSVEDVSSREAVIRDRVVAVVITRSSADLATPSGENALKHDILQALRHDFNDEVVDVYFTGYLVE